MMSFYCLHITASLFTTTLTFSANVNGLIQEVYAGTPAVSATWAPLHPFIYRRRPFSHRFCGWHEIGLSDKAVNILDGCRKPYY